MNGNGKLRFDTSFRFVPRGAALASLLAVVLLCTNSAHAQSNPAAGPNAAGSAKVAVADTATVKTATIAKTPTKPVQSAANPGGAHDGIVVHGNWTLKVRNPDGSISRTVEFENSLQSGGEAMLVSLLQANQTMGSWIITFQGSVLQGIGSPSPCSTSPGNSTNPVLVLLTQSCIIAMPSAPANWLSTLANGGTCAVSAAQAPAGQTQPYCYATLTDSSAGFVTLTFIGQAYVDTSTSIGYVNLFGYTCSSAVAQLTSCSTGSISLGQITFSLFTAHSIPSPGIPVTAGQTVEATVVISFSSAS